MTTRPILIIPEPVLRARAEPVAEIDDGIKTLVKDMFETMYDAPGIGLAAPQVGVLQRVVVIDLQNEESEDNGQIAMVNPEITWRSEETAISEEGCLSIPELYYEVERPAEIKIRYQNLNGEVVEREARGKLAVCMQHEVDHLDGVLYIDYLSRLKRERVIKKFQKAAKRAAE